MDSLRIQELKIFARHGVAPEEREKGQTFYVNAELFLDTFPAAERDDLTLTVNYSEVCHLIEDTMTKASYDLIETAAHEAAIAVLHSFPALRGLRLEVRKPDAPIPADFGSVSVCVERGWHQAVIALGSNIGDTRGFLEGAVKTFRESRLFRNVEVSDFILTKPYGLKEQPDFLNGAMICDTLLSPRALLSFLQAAENAAGRERKVHWGPRTLDLDLIFYEDKIFSEADLRVPHPDMQHREFVLRPLAQIAPYYLHPVLGKTVKELWEALS